MTSFLLAFYLDSPPKLELISDYLILMDISMPIMDGLEATRKLRQMGVTIPIIAMTANVGEADKKAALDAGMNAFTEKPIFVDKLFQAINACLGR